MRITITPKNNLFRLFTMKTFFSILLLLSFAKIGTHYALKNCQTTQKQRDNVLLLDLARKKEDIKLQRWRMIRKIERTPYVSFPSADYNTISGFYRAFENVNSYDSLAVFLDKQIASLGFEVEKQVYSQLPESARFLSLKHDFIRFYNKIERQKRNLNFFGDKLVPVVIQPPKDKGDSIEVEVRLLMTLSGKAEITLKETGEKLPVDTVPFYYEGSYKDVLIKIVNPETNNTVTYGNR